MGNLHHGDAPFILFSKCLRELDWVQFAGVTAELGFDGVDLTVRRGGHVEPERVEQDLPEAVRIIRAAGLQIPMISTDIVNADDPLAERVLRTAASLGITHYRLGAFYYSVKLSIEEDLRRMERTLSKLAALSEKHNIVANFQNHSLDSDLGVQFGHYFGSTIWDLSGVLRSIDSPWIGAQYDIGHATIECTRSWAVGMDLLLPHIKSLHVKDFVWEKQACGWEPVPVPIGHGMVDYARFFGMVRQAKLAVPIVVYVGYPIGSRSTGYDLSTIQQELLRLRALAHGGTHERA